MSFYEATYVSQNSNYGFLSDVAMIVGLSRKTSSTQTLLVDELYQQGRVFASLFCLNLSPGNEFYAADFIDFGEIIQTEIQDYTKLEYLTLEEDTKEWSVTTSAVRFGTDNDFALSTSFRAVFDMSSSFIRLPPSWSDAFLLKMTENVNVYTQNGWITVRCDDENLIPVSFLAGGYWIEANPADYAIDISAN